MNAFDIVLTPAERELGGQAVKVLEHSIAGSEAGVTALAHLGPELTTTLASFAATGAEADAAFQRFVDASVNFERRRGQAAQLMLAEAAIPLDALLAKTKALPAAEVATLRATLQRSLRLALEEDEAALAAIDKIVEKNKVFRAVRGLALQHELAMAGGRKAFRDLLASLSHAGGQAESGRRAALADP